MRLTMESVWTEKAYLLRAACSQFRAASRTAAQTVQLIETLSKIDLSNIKFWESKVCMAERDAEEFNLPSAEAHSVNRH